MLYTIVGAVFGGFVTYVGCKLTDVDSRSFGFIPSNLDLCVIVGTFAGACVGFGVGANALANGTHVFNKV